MVITEVTSELHFFAQLVDQGSKFEAMMAQMQVDLKESPPVQGAYTPKSRDMCIAKFDDGLWYVIQYIYLIIMIIIIIMHSPYCLHIGTEQK